eukprot:COSAG04_NODE_10501_length_772_cov_1.598811_1_plen_29_part_01
MEQPTFLRARVGHRNCSQRLERMRGGAHA